MTRPSVVYLIACPSYCLANRPSFDLGILLFFLANFGSFGSTINGTGRPGEPPPHAPLDLARLDLAPLTAEAGRGRA